MTTHNAQPLALQTLATSIAALAGPETQPEHILSQFSRQLSVDAEQLLCEHASRYGYPSMRAFETALLEQIGEQMEHLKSCHLTAADRAQKRLIDAL